MQFIIPNVDICMSKEDDNKYPKIDQFPWYRVNAVLSTLNSGSTINVASILGAYRMPLIGSVSTSEDVSQYYVIIINLSLNISWTFIIQILCYNYKLKFKYFMDIYNIKILYNILITLIIHIVIYY